MIAPLMHDGMDRQHLEEVTMETESLGKPACRLYLRTNWVKG